MGRAARGLVALSLIFAAAAAAIGPVGADHSILFGAHPAPRTGETKQQATLNLESAIGRPLAVVRVYYRWDQPVGTFATWLRDTGHTLFVSVKAKRQDGTAISWRDIADAAPGSPLYQDIVNWAATVKTLGPTVLFSFNHEPEGSASATSGTSVDFVDAWRKVVTVFREQGVTNAEYVWTMTADSYSATDQKAAALWYPGDEWVDDIAADGFNWFTCRGAANNPWRSAAELFEPFRQFSLSHPDEGLIVAEWASVEDTATPDRKAQWIADASVTFRGADWERLRAVLYFHGQDSGYANCAWWADTSASSTLAFSAMANDPRFMGGLAPSPSPSTEPSPSASPSSEPSPSPSPDPSPSPSPSPSPTPDTTPPSVAITAPADGAIVARGSLITITADASDEGGVARVDFRVNGSLKCTDTGPPYTCAWRVPKKAGPSYVLEATAIDVAGNTAAGGVRVTAR